MRHFPRSGLGILSSVLLTTTLGAGLATADDPGAKPGKLELRYLRNSGWLVHTARHTLVFDYIGPDAGRGQTVDEATVTAADLGRGTALVFTTHRHKDHFDPAILDWQRKVEDLTYVFGWKDDTVGDHLTLAAREFVELGGVRVRTIASTDTGVGFFVEVDGRSVFHAGDHARWTEEQAGPFDAEIDYLAEHAGTVDVALFPIATGAFSGCQARDSIFQGVVYAARRLKPEVVIPMHVDCPDKLGLYEQFRQKLTKALPGVTVLVARAPGHRLEVPPQSD